MRIHCPKCDRFRNWKTTRKMKTYFMGETKVQYEMDVIICAKCGEELHKGNASIVPQVNRN